MYMCTLEIGIIYCYKKILGLLTKIPISNSSFSLLPLIEILFPTPLEVGLIKSFFSRGVLKIYSSSILDDPKSQLSWDSQNEDTESNNIS